MAGATPSQGRTQGPQQPEEPRLPGPGPPASLPGTGLPTKTRRVTPGSSRKNGAEAHGGGYQGRSPGPGVAAGSRIRPRRQGPGPFPTLGKESSEHFPQGCSTVKKGPPCVVTPCATILACARDHVDGGSAEPAAPRASTLVQKVGMQGARGQDSPGTDDVARPNEQR